MGCIQWKSALWKHNSLVQTVQNLTARGPQKRLFARNKTCMYLCFEGETLNLAWVRSFIVKSKPYMLSRFTENKSWKIKHEQRTSIPFQGRIISKWTVFFVFICLLTHGKRRVAMSWPMTAVLFWSRLISAACESGNFRATDTQTASPPSTHSATKPYPIPPYTPHTKIHWVWPKISDRQTKTTIFVCCGVSEITMVHGSCAMYLPIFSYHNIFFWFMHQPSVGGEDFGRTIQVTLLNMSTTQQKRPSQQSINEHK